jgi:hypothetical protein
VHQASIRSIKGQSRAFQGLVVPAVCGVRACGLLVRPTADGAPASRKNCARARAGCSGRLRAASDILYKNSKRAHTDDIFFQLSF